MDARAAKIGQLNKVAFWHTLYWVTVTLLVLIERNAIDSPVVEVALILLLGGKGMFLQILLWSMLPSWKPTEALEVTKLNQSINKALRKEVLDLTSMGIVQSLMMQKWMHVVMRVAKGNPATKDSFWRLHVHEASGNRRGLPAGWADKVQGDGQVQRSRAAYAEWLSS